jgi:CheY-like chemotaxis protein/predicted regulator of Ras-like GTPase activity (Roadblock/LC7/MglB family)
MKNVLVVANEKPFLLSLSDGLSTYAGEFNVLTAGNGRKAVEVLGSVRVDLGVVDLDMPEMEGFELLAHMGRKHPEVSIIVMTAFDAPEMKDGLNATGFQQYIEKPPDYTELATKIHEQLEAGPEGRVNGITLPAFVQLLEMEKKTCTVKAASNGRLGHLYFDKGEFMEAETGKSKGEKAACEIIGWEKADMEVDRACRKKKKKINSPLHEIIAETFRIKDDKKGDTKEGRRDKGRKRTGVLPEAIFGEGGESEGHELQYYLTKDEAALLEAAIGEGNIPELIKQKHLTKEEVMALENHLQGLKEVKGYKAAGIMNFTGELLASDSADSNIDLGLVGATFNDIFRSAHEASQKIGLEACKETVINTPKGVIVMRCSGVKAKAHFHIIGIMEGDGNQALMKMQIDKMVPAILEELT